MIVRVLPAVNLELRRWTALAQRCPDELLRREALASLGAKRFHCQGGAALALLAGPRWREAVKFIVALQTISDYLDNLCDRAGCEDRAALRRLHLAMLHAVDPPAHVEEGVLPDYYSLYPATDDGGYLSSLVSTCALYSAGLPPSVRRSGRRLVSLYRSMQALKHGPADDRVEGLRRWFRRARPMLTRRDGSPGGETVTGPALDDDAELLWPEFAAVCGSTLAVFSVYSRAARVLPGPQNGRACAELLDGYFPWICGLHILLDYFIDREEDARSGDLNLTRYYVDDAECEGRLLLFVERALSSARRMEWAAFHRTVVTGLLAVYLSDAKVAEQGLEPAAGRLLDAAGVHARNLRALCLGLRRSGLV